MTAISEAASKATEDTAAAVSYLKGGFDPHHKASTRLRSFRCSAPATEFYFHFCMAAEPRQASGMVLSKAGLLGAAL